MSDPTPSSPYQPTIDPSEIERLRKEISQNHAALHLCLMAGIFSSVGSAILIGYQLRQVSRELKERTPAIEQIRTENAKIDGLIEQFRQFGKSYPDYTPVLAKFGLSPATSAAPASVLQPALPTVK